MIQGEVPWIFYVRNIMADEADIKRWQRFLKTARTARTTMLKIINNKASSPDDIRIARKRFEEEDFNVKRLEALLNKNSISTRMHRRTRG